MLCISSKIIGHRDGKHLLLLDEHSVQWVTRCPAEAYYFSGEIKIGRKCFDSLLSMSCIEVNEQPPQRFVKMMGQLTRSMSKVPWQSVMPPVEYSSFVKSLTVSALDAYGKCVRPYYESTWAKGNIVLEALRPACIDTEFFDSTVQAEAHVSAALKSFAPNADGFSKRPTNNRLGTRTGRLTHAAGPDYLTLKKKYRHVIKSRFGDMGKIIYIDFSAIEVRVLFYEAGVVLSDADIYQNLSDEHFEGKIARDTLKHAVISCIYDQKDVVLSSLLGQSLDDTRVFMRYINALVQKNKLLHKLKLEYIASQAYITNKYGRRVAITEPLDRMFINSFAQSTAVDVALMGFSQIVQSKCDDSCIPLGIIHDGMLFDCHNSVLDRFPNMFKIDIPGFEQPFILKSEVL